jgi:predicted phosphoribosyltransferase
MKPDLPYRNRAEAGRFLAGELAHYKSKPEVIVLGLTRGGVPVAGEVAAALQAPLDVIVVRKLGAPFQPELAMGAIAPEGTQVLDQEIIRAFGLIDQDVVKVIAKERSELERRERLYRAGRPPLDLKNRTAILVDDGLATGSTMLAAVAFAKKRSAQRIVLAVPIASVEAMHKLRGLVDEWVCPETPEPFFAVGEWYWNFLPVNDAEVLKLLQEGFRRIAAPAGVKPAA